MARDKWLRQVHRSHLFHSERNVYSSQEFGRWYSHLAWLFCQRKTCCKGSKIWHDDNETKGRPEKDERILDQIRHKGKRCKNKELLWNCGQQNWAQRYDAKQVLNYQIWRATYDRHKAIQADILERAKRGSLLWRSQFTKGINLSVASQGITNWKRGLYCKNFRQWKS